MPLPMVHLYLAKGIEENIQFEFSPYYYLGNISPDAIHSRPGSTREDKDRTHLFSRVENTRNPQDISGDKIKNILELCFETGDSKMKEFALGYAVHSLLDMNWIMHIFRPFDRQLRASGLNYYDVRRVYYDETKACDLSLYNEYGWIRDLLVVLKGTTEFDFMNVLSKEEIRDWKEVTLNKMWDPQNNYIVDPHYITVDSIKKFVGSLIPEIVGVLRGWGCFIV